METNGVGGGWIKVHRTMRSHAVSQHNGLLRLWMHCLWLANWKAKSDVIPGTVTPIVIERGQFITGRESLLNSVYGPMYRSDDKPTSRTLWRWLDTLHKLGCVNVRTMSNRCSIVTVCNYATYQEQSADNVQPDGQAESKSGPADRPADVPLTGGQVSTTEEGNKETRGRSEEGKKDSCSELPKTAPTEPPVMVFPTSGKTTSWDLTQTKLDEYADSYPHLDLLAECRKARQWCIDNVAKRKTAAGMSKFLNGWLSRAQNGDGIRRPATNGAPANVSTADPRGNIQVMNAALEKMCPGGAQHGQA